MQRLKQKEVLAYRNNELATQCGKCLISGKQLLYDQAVLDHSHQTHQIRGVLSRGSNALLGRIENNCRRHGVTFTELPAWLRGAADYLERPQLEILHPSYRTEEEKRLRRNKKAAKRRKAKQ